MSRLSSSRPPSPSKTTPSEAPPLLDSPQSPRRVTRVEPNLLLDPHGMSGTATARRLRASRQRRQWQMIALLVAGAVVLGFGAWLLRPQEARIEVKRRATWPFSPASSAVAKGNELWIAGRDGALWRGSVENGLTAPKRLGAGGWPARSAPVLTSEHVVLAAPDGEISAFEIGSNRLAWRRALGGSVSSTPLFVDDSLIVGNDEGRLMCLDARTGRDKWTARASGPIGQGLAATRANGSSMILAPTLAGSGSGGALQAFDAQTGKMRWRFPGESRALAAGVAVPFFDESAKRIYWANDEGAAFALDAQTGRKIWKTFARPLSGATGQNASPVVLRGGPILVEGVVIVGGNDGAARGFDAQTGRELWASPVGGPILQRALQLKTRGVVMMRGGDEIVVLQARDGRVLERVSVPGLVSLTLVENAAWALDEEGNVWRLNVGS